MNRGKLVVLQALIERKERECVMNKRNGKEGESWEKRVEQANALPDTRVLLLTSCVVWAKPPRLAFHNIRRLILVAAIFYHATTIATCSTCLVHFLEN